MLRRWARLNGVSRTISTRRRRSLSMTSAARVSRLSPKPCAIAASDFIVQGATTIACAAKLPLAMQAPMSPMGQACMALAASSSRASPSSWCTLITPEGVTTRCVSAPSSPRRSSSRTPYVAPEAPVIPTMMAAEPGVRGGATGDVKSGGQQGLQLARFVHLHQDVRAADELAVDVQLRDRRPVGVVLDALAHFAVLEHVDRLQVAHAAGLEDLDGAAGEAALRKLG